MTRKILRTWAAAMLALAMMVGSASAQVTPFIWKDTLTGAQDWQLDGNWTTSAFPNGPLHTANTQVALGSALNLNVGATDVIVAGLELGSTGSAVATTVSGAGGRLVFRNDDLATGYNLGNPLIVSGGVSGSSNTISAPILINGEKLEVGAASTNDLVISGPITYNGAFSAGIRSYLPSGKKVLVTGSIDLTDHTDAATELVSSFFFINDSTTNQGTLEISGVMSGIGGLNIGSSSSNALRPLSTTILSGANTFTGIAEADRGNIVLANDNALGANMNGANPAQYRQGQPSNQFGFNFISDNDNRTISRRMNLSQFQSVKGTNSLTWAGEIIQGNNRGFINLLPEGKKLTLSGNIHPLSGTDSGLDTERVFTLDGSGRTEVTGKVANRLDDDSTTGGIRKRGPGAVYIKGSQAVVPVLNSYNGQTYIDGGNLHFAVGTDMGNSLRVLSTAGAIGLDNGTIVGPDSSTLLGKLNNFASPQAGLLLPLPAVTGDFRFLHYDHGGLMLTTAGDAAANLDFTSGDLANAADMSVAAPEGGISYTGTITPANNNYRLGGGSGTLTIPNANQLTGATNNVIATNGGVVNVTGLQNYSGTTSIVAKYVRSNTQQAIADFAANNNELGLLGTTLQASKLANGGVASSIGNSSSAASNLVIQGGTLKYTGAGDSTDRSFTIGTAGATLDASGSGAINFTNASAPTHDVAEARVANISAINLARNIIYDIPSTADLLVGMTVTDSASVGAVIIPANTTISEILGPNSVRISANVGLLDENLGDTFTFGTPARTLSLTGSNTGNNILAAPLADSNGVLNVTKSGAGKWVLNGATTYTGRTTISEGTLELKQGVTTLAGNGLTLAAGATLNLELASASSFDLINLTGATLAGGGVNLAGTINLSLLGGFAPGNGATFDVITMVGAADAPLSITGLTIAGAPGFTASVITSGDSLTKTLRLTKSGGLLAGDYNGNGTVDAADYTLYRDAAGTSTVLMNDAIGGVIGPAHYTQWANNFGATAGAAIAASSAVPEPATLVLVLAGVCLLATRRRSVR